MQEIPYGKLHFLLKLWSEFKLCVVATRTNNMMHILWLWLLLTLADRYMRNETDVFPVCTQTLLYRLILFAW